ncbi:unnamed protein product [Cuscuta epithymum]|uniref:Uncharacterized protein n=1 Tax=Cuscuta epithymum TaxID=186058 RepID=A0AAV0E1H6_9ASTE|nr:unnamed protein product [Cuscuta epithymum]
MKTENKEEKEEKEEEDEKEEKAEGRRRPSKFRDEAATNIGPAVTSGPTNRRREAVRRRINRHHIASQRDALPPGALPLRCLIEKRCNLYLMGKSTFDRGYSRPPDSK